MFFLLDNEENLKLQFFAGHMSFLITNQECHSTDGNHRFLIILLESKQDYIATRKINNNRFFDYCTSLLFSFLISTSGSAVAEELRDALVSRNSATYKTSHLKTIVWHYLQTDGQTHDDRI